MKAKQIIAEQEKRLETQFRAIDEIALFNQNKVLNAFREERIALRHFNPSTGYGYGDEGKEALARIFARTFGGDRAIVSPALLSGTHALTVALFGILRPGIGRSALRGRPTIRFVA